VAVPVAPRKLTPKQALFVAEYLADRNGIQAAIRVGVPAKNARGQSYKWLNKSHIWQQIEAELRLSFNRADVTKSRTLHELSILAFSNIEHYMINEAGRLVTTADAPPGAMRAISSVKQKRRQTTDSDGNTTVEHEVEYRLWSKNEALRDAMKHLGMLTDEPTPIHIDVNISLADRLTQALERAHAQRKQATLKVA
jgi:phage terminase small subunit